MKSVVAVFALVVLLSASLAGPAFAQTADVKNELVSYIQGLGLPAGQAQKALSLTRDFLVKLQESSTDLLGVFGQAQKADPQEQEKQHTRFAAIQKEFQVAFEKYKLDMADVVGNGKATPIIEKVSAMVPAVLLENPAAGNSHASHVAQASQPSGLSTTDSGTANTSTEVPIGASDPATSGSSNLDLQVSDKSNASSGMGDMGRMDMGEMSGMGMDQMMGGNMMDSMMNMMSMMGGMGGSSASNGMSGQTMSGLDQASSQALGQLMGNNGQLLQSLAVIPAGAQGSYLQSALQPARQILTQQSTLVQILFGRLSGAGQMPSMDGMPGMNAPANGSMNGMGMGMSMGSSGSTGASSSMSGMAGMPDTPGPQNSTGMTGMSGMQGSSDMSSMMGMPGMSGTNMNGSSGTMAPGSDPATSMMLTQLHANYVAIAQMLATAKAREDLAPVYQMLSMQGSMIQMLFTHLSNNSGSGSSNGSMGSMSHK